MKRFYIFLSIFALVFALNANAQQVLKHKVVVDSKTQDVMPMTDEIIEQLNQPVMPNEIKPIQINTNNREEQRTFHKPLTRPQAEDYEDPVPIQWLAWQDTSDSSISYASPTLKTWDGQDSTRLAPLIGIQPQATPMYGIAQFFPQQQGRLTIDSMRVGLFRYSSLPPYNTNFLLIGVGLQQDNLQDTAQGNIINWAVEDFADQILIYDQLDLTQINNAVQANGGIRYVVHHFTEPMVLEPYTDFGFLVYPETENMQAYGALSHYEWQLPVKECFGSVLVHNQQTSIDSIKGTYFYVWSIPASDAHLWPALYNQPIKQNFVFVLLGTFEELITSVEVGEADELSLMNYPNPANDQTTVKYSIPEAGNVKIVLYDVSGKEYGTLVNEYQTGSTYEFNISTGYMPAGTYYYTMEYNGQTVTKQLNVVR